jgi:hypothetical protein
MKKIVEFQKERRELLKAKSQTKDKAKIKELDAQLKETVKRSKALSKEYETAIDDEPTIYAKPE